MCIWCKCLNIYNTLTLGVDKLVAGGKWQQSYGAHPTLLISALCEISSFRRRHSNPTWCTSFFDKSDIPVDRDMSGLQNADTNSSSTKDK